MLREGWKGHGRQSPGPFRLLDENDMVEDVDRNGLVYKTV